MGKVFKKYLNESETYTILDVGSMDINGTYKRLITSSTWKYIGADQSEGNNVDLIIKDYRVPMNDGSVDVVISGQTFEHVKNPFKLMGDISRVLKKEGLVFVVAPFIFPKHGYPIDTFRYLPDGWQAVLEESGLEMVESYFINSHKGNVDCWAIGKKP
jgi:SAM-dependent methyltransferase